jgi:3-oxoadipate enol-lactonase
MLTTRVGDLNIVWDVAGPPDGEPVLMINGLGSPRDAWVMQVPVLSERYRVITYDNRDVGQTGAGSDPKPYRMDQFARDAVGLVEALELGPVHVIGASMGGAIALELALARPELVQSLQIVCSWPRPDPWLADLVEQWNVMYAALGSLAWARNTWLWVFTHRWFQDPTHIDELIRNVESYQHPQLPAMFARQCDAILAFDALDRLGTIDQPTHVIAGAEDIFTPPRYSQAIATAILRSRLTVLPHVGHGMFWETADAFNALLLGFLDEHRARAR